MGKPEERILPATVEELTAQTGITEGSRVRFEELRREPTPQHPDGEVWRQEAEVIVRRLIETQYGDVQAETKGPGNVGVGILIIRDAILRQIEDGKITVLND